MAVENLIRTATTALFAVLFAVTLARAVRQPVRIWIETALFFGCATLLVSDSRMLRHIGSLHQQWISAVNVSILLAMALLLLKLIDNMSAIPRPVVHTAAVGFVILVVVIWAVGNPDSASVLVPAVTYFGLVVVFSSIVMMSTGIRASGVARRRTLAVGIGSLLLCCAAVFSVLRFAFPDVAGIPHSLIDGPLALAAGLSYYTGFATPNFVRQAWQDRALREFFARTMKLARVSDLTEIALGLETAAQRSFGGLPVSLVVWDARAEVLMPITESERVQVFYPGHLVEGKAFVRQRPVVSTNLERDEPSNSAWYRKLGVNAVICVPVSVGDRFFGVLGVYGRNPPVFVEDDLMMVKLMADQAAIILETHALLEQTTRLRAREEATRLKDDFLAAAAHDLSNPLTAVVMQAQLIGRRTRRFPDSPVDQSAIDNLIDLANRLQSFVTDLLDVQRLDSQGLSLSRSEIDLSEIAAEAAQRVLPARHLVRLELQRPVLVNGDPARISRLIDNLLNNAVKYSPDGGEIILRLWSDGNDAHLTVRDHGIGIPEDDVPQVFDRFQRARNVEGASLRGVGLGLFICREIVEAHGGSISVTSQVGRGSEFHAVLPVEAREPYPEPDDVRTSASQITTADNPLSSEERIG